MSENPDQSTPNIGELLLLNRCLFEGRGDDFVIAFADYVEKQGLIISEQSMGKLVRAAAFLRLSQEAFVRQ